ncbi:MAG: sulfotransferase [Flavobacteriales bacterium]
MEEVGKPILIMSSERSGSNLLRSILSSHPNIYGPVALQLWRTLSRVEEKYGDFQYDENVKELADDALSIAKLEGTRFTWALKATPDDVLENLVDRSFSGVLLTIYELYAKQNENSIYVIKENDLYEYAKNIVDANNKTKVIYLVRDGRDVACSEKSVPTKNRHIYLLANQWNFEQQKALKVYNELSDKHCFLLKYEDLISDFENKVNELTEFLEIEPSDNMLEFYQNKEVKQQSKATDAWKNISSPIKRKNTGKYKDELSKADIKLYEKVAGNMLTKFDYECDTGQYGSGVNPVMDFYYRVYNKFYKLAVGKDFKYPKEDKKFINYKKEIVKKRANS